MSRKLTGKQLAFCRWYVSAEVDFNATEAARRAGYKGNATTLAAMAYENIRKPHIAAHIEKLRAEALSGASITVEKVLRDLEVTRAKALADGQYTAAKGCSELQGKYLKMFTDRVEHVQAVEDVSDEELAQLIQELMLQAGGEQIIATLLTQLGDQASVDIGRVLAPDGPENGAVPRAAGKTTTH